MKLGEELVKLATQRYFMEVIDCITYEDLKRLATKVTQLEAENEQFGATIDSQQVWHNNLKAENRQLREGLQLWIDFAANSLAFRMFLASDERYHKVFRLTFDALGGK